MNEVTGQPVAAAGGVQYLQVVCSSAPVTVYSGCVILGYPPFL